MSAPGGLNAAARRTVLGDRNAVPQGTNDAPNQAGKLRAIQNSNTTSTIVISGAQENRVQGNPKSTGMHAMAFVQPAQRPAKTVAPAISMVQLRPTVHRKTDSLQHTIDSLQHTKGSLQHRTNNLRKALSRASVSAFVYKDPQEEEGESEAAPAGLARPATEVPLPVVQIHAMPVRPSTANMGNLGKQQEQLVDMTSSKPLSKPQGLQSLQPEHPKAQGLPLFSRYSQAEAQQHQNPILAPTNPSRLHPPGGAPTPASPRTDDDVTGPTYVDAVEHLAQEQTRPSSYAPVPLHPSTLSIIGQLVPERAGGSRTSGVPSEVSLPHHNTQPYTTPALVNDQAYSPCLSDSEDDDDGDDNEDHDCDDRGYTTNHSYRSRGDNTTGGVTTVMFAPRNTKKDQAEIEDAKHFVETRRTTDKVQEEDTWDVSMVAEYGDEIFHFMKELEMSLLPDAHYMDNQGEIKWSMRSVLMDWVVQVHGRFGLLPETLFLTVNCIDRFLTRKIVSLGKLQLVGATAIFIAAKFEEINCPSVQEIVYMVDGGYTIEEILKAERFMLSMLEFELGWPGPMSFLRRVSKADEYNVETRTLAKYFLEVVIMDERFVATPASYIAAGAHCLSRLMLRKGQWTPAHVHYSGYTYRQLKPLISMLLDCCRHARKHHCAVFEKYTDKRYKQASTFVQDEIMKGFNLPFEHRLSMPYSLDSFNNETTHTSHAGSLPKSYSVKMPIPTHG
ncbi:cyclin-like protein [Nemania sp. FL0916]|nr:cyclin-like protein [Nemania sp. FL0916]